MSELIARGISLLSEAGWRTGDRKPLRPDALRFEFWPAIREMLVLGILSTDFRADRPIQLTRFGETAAPAILWYRAIRPRFDL